MRSGGEHCQPKLAVEVRREHCHPELAVENEAEEQVEEKEKEEGS